MTQKHAPAPAKPEQAAPTVKRSETRERLDQAKREVDTKKKVFDMVQDFFKDFSKLTSKERIQRIGAIVATAAISTLIAGKEGVKKGVDAARNLASRATQGRQERQAGKERKSAEEGDREALSGSAAQRPPEMCIDPALVGEVESDLPVCRNTKDSEKIVEDHRHNAALLELLPGKKGKLDKFLEKFEANRARYERVAKAAHLPAALIAAIHYREGSMNFNGYLHNGDPLGSPTTHVPKGILFRKGQWEEAAIHALGGNIKDANGRRSLQYKRKLRQQLGIDENTTDMGKLLTFAEKYNGLGYRGRNLRSCYVYGGTNLNCQGMYVADHEFDPNKKDQRLGIAAMLMGAQTKESGESLRVASSNQTLPNQPTAKPSGKVVALPRRTEKPDSQGKPVQLTTNTRSRAGLGGTYEVESVNVPAGYTRRGTGKLPSKTQGKLSRIATRLRTDRSMEMFTGIPMVVDGYDVMMVKEQHMTPMKNYGKEGLSDYYYKPHTGVAYLMKIQDQQLNLAA